MDLGPSVSSIDRLQRTERLLDLSRRLSSTLEFQAFLETLIAAAEELTGCEAASILELEEGGESLRFLAVPWFHRELLKSIQVPVQDSVAGWVIENGKPAIIPDAGAEARHFKGADTAANFITRSLMAVPISFQGKTLGVLEAVNKNGEAHYTEEDLTILETLASQASIALQFVHLMTQLEKSREQTSQLDHMKSDFIAIASHELRTPVGLILGHATFLQEVVPPDFRAQMDTIARNAMRLKDIIDSIANIDNIQRGTASLRPGAFSIRRVIEELAASFAEEADRKNITLHSDIEPGDINIEGDETKITTAISNVLKNALDFTNPGGHVYIIASQISAFIKVSVIDDGIGIPAKDLSHIFERFYQVESHLTRRHGGMGLGLSVAKAMIEIHGGRIWVESVEGKGSNFTFILPVKPENRPDSPTQAFIS